MKYLLKYLLATIAFFLMPFAPRQRVAENHERPAPIDAKVGDTLIFKSIPKN